MLHPDALQRPLAEDILQHEVVHPFRHSLCECHLILSDTTTQTSF
ncbi:hypothetical protein Plhal304r1_c047g0129141 [Plasmopara halstedii]